MQRLWSGSRAIVMGFIGARVASGCRSIARGSTDRPIRLFLGLRDFGPWWAELYRIPGEPVYYVVQLLASHGGRPDFRAAWLDIGHHGTVSLAMTGNSLSAWVPAKGSILGELRLVAERRDGTVLTASWE